MCVLLRDMKSCLSAPQGLWAWDELLPDKHRISDDDDDGDNCDLYLLFEKVRALSIIIPFGEC